MWRHGGTRYNRWIGSAWSQQDSVGSGTWRTTGSGGALDAYDIYSTVVLNGGARVDNHM